MTNNSLQHYGIKGMRWGIRRYQNEDGTLTDIGKKRFVKNKDNKKKESRKMDLKKRRFLSEKQLKKKIERLKLENDFKSLTEDDVASGKKYVFDIMKSVGTKTLATVASGAVTYGIKVFMTKRFDISEAASYIAANPNKKK